MLDKVTQIETIKYDRDVSYSYAASRLSTHWTNLWLGLTLCRS
ncbi:E family protein [Staphylococcus aureus]|nr:E family protein [Staphylococcus aureus]